MFITDAARHQTVAATGDSSRQSVEALRSENEALRNSINEAEEAVSQLSSAADAQASGEFLLTFRRPGQGRCISAGWCNFSRPAPSDAAEQCKRAG